MEMDKEAKKKRAELCQKCYFCESGVDKSKSVDDLGEERAQKCKQCYFCATEETSITPLSTETSAETPCSQV